MDLQKAFYAELFVSVLVADVGAEQCTKIFDSQITPYSQNTEMFFKEQNELENKPKSSDTIEKIKKSNSTTCCVFCFRDTKQTEETLGILQHNKILLSEIYEHSIQKQSEKKNKRKQIKSTNDLREKLHKNVPV